MMTDKEAMTWNRDHYMEDINNQVEEYKTTIKEFKAWLTENGYEDEFQRQLKNTYDGKYGYDDYDIAYDFGIPVVMVKYFRKTA